MSKDQNQDLRSELDELNDVNFVNYANDLDETEEDDKKTEEDAFESTDSDVSRETEEKKKASSESEDTDSEEDEEEFEEEDSGSDVNTSDNEEEDSGDEDSNSVEERIQSLMAEVERLSAIIVRGGEDMSKEKEKNSTESHQKDDEKEIKVEPLINPEEIKKKILDFDFFQDSDPEELFENPKTFNKRLVEYGSAISEGIIQQVYLNVPKMVEHQSRVQTELRQVVQDFYADNEDLKPLKSFVGQTANKIASEHSDYTVEQVFSEAAKKVRTALKLSKGKKGKRKIDEVETDANKVSIKGKRNSSKKKITTKKKTKLQAQLDELY